MVAPTTLALPPRALSYIRTTPWTDFSDVSILDFWQEGHPTIEVVEEWPKLNAAGQPEPMKYLVTIAADCPPGIYEARVMTRLGLSSARIFSVNVVVSAAIACTLFLTLLLLLLRLPLPELLHVLCLRCKCPQHP